MLSNNKKIAEIGSEVESLEHIVKVLKDELFAVQDEVREQGKKIEALEASLKEKQDIISEQEKEIQKWNEGIANIMNYSLDVAKGGNKP